MIAVIDYNVGNIGSVMASLKKIGYEAVLTSDEDTILNASKVILPGVGAFSEAITKLKERNLDKVIYKLIEQKKCIIAICVGMQILCEGSLEDGFHEGLGVFKGVLKPFEHKSLNKVQIGWNNITLVDSNSILKEFNNEYFYFVHSYYLDINTNTLATTEYGNTYSSILHKDNIFAFQFHPEKSGSVGLKLLKRVLDYENSSCN